MDKANEEETIGSIVRSIEFKGTNLWILICAILIASLGLNTNSTAVVIGAMLISPIMGPIMGIGLGLGINDFDLLKKSLNNYAIASLIGILTSCLYFYLSPISDAQSELLARTQPTVYDVLIAFVGGLAGILALSSREKGNVIIGVAIATALMPPLCTAGYGIASGNFAYFAGAFYLYFINTVFISAATFLGSRFFRFSPKQFLDPAKEKRVSRTVALIICVTMVPSVYFAYTLVQDSVYQSNSNKFIQNELNFPQTEILKKEISRKPTPAIEVLLMGKEVPDMAIDMARTKLHEYNLSDVNLIINQSAKDKQNLNVADLKALVMSDFYKNSEDQLALQRNEIAQLKSEIGRYTLINTLAYDMHDELKILFPQIKELGLSLLVQHHIDQTQSDTILIASLKLNSTFNTSDQLKFKKWLDARSKIKYPCKVIWE